MVVKIAYFGIKEEKVTRNIMRAPTLFFGE